MIVFPIMFTLFCACTLIFLSFPALAGKPPIMIMDFDSGSYADWIATGEAFGPGPAHGTLASQMPVSGFIGQGLVNTYFKGDGTTGSLTSPPFRIQRRFIHFLIGGGQYPDTACITLLLNRKIVRTATGPNDEPGGSERLSWHTWDVSDLQDQEVVLQIQDQETGGWGHINIDHIFQSDGPAEVTAMKEFVFRKPFLNMPVKNGADMRKLKLSVEGGEVREFDIELAEKDPDFWVFMDVGEFRGRRGTIELSVPATEEPSLFAAIANEDLLRAEDLYKEKLRPQFHFSSRRGWNNDPNGMVFYKDEYHLFYQHNPYGWRWGNMTWGHAVSRDMIHWKEMADALHPDALGTIFSGSGVVDHHNTTGFQTGQDRPLICIYTSAGDCVTPKVPFTQSIAYSNDAGRTWKKYPENPVIPNIIGANRDPKVLWYDPAQKWVMALFLDGNDYALLESKDLKSWSKLCDVKVPECGECPDFFELPVEGEALNKWVFWGANGSYLIGQFDGKTFLPEGSHQKLYAGGNAYAAQTFSDIPAEDGRRIQMPWLQCEMPGMPFNQMMGIPIELRIRRFEEGLRMVCEPVKEVRSLRRDKKSWKGTMDSGGRQEISGIRSDLMDIEATLFPEESGECGLVVRGEAILYNAQNQILTCRGIQVPLKLDKSQVQMRILVDRTSLELFADGGRIYLPCAVHFKEDQHDVSVISSQGRSEVNVEVHELSPIWE